MTELERLENRLQIAAELYTRALDAFRAGDTTDTTALSIAARALAEHAKRFGKESCRTTNVLK